MTQCGFAFGLNGRYIYQGSGRISWIKATGYSTPSTLAANSEKLLRLPEHIDPHHKAAEDQRLIKIHMRNVPSDLGSIKDIKGFRCAAFGDKEDSYFFSYTTKDDRNLLVYGAGVPVVFKDWLVSPETGKVRRSKDVRAVFGPNESFVAWDGDSFRWSKIPPKLEEIFQEWLSHRERSGRPRLVALGYNNSFLAISDKGACSCSSLPSGLFEKIQALKEKHAVEGIQAITLSIFSPHFVLASRNNYCYVTPDGQDEKHEDTLCAALDTLIPSHCRAELKIKRLQTRLKTKQQYIDKLKLERAAQDTKITFLHWRRDCDEYFTTKDRTAFITIPKARSGCVDRGCMVRKDDRDGVRACRHDIKILLQGSGQYSVAYLRKERLRWHPDKFSRDCASEARHELTRKATFMYSVFEELLAEENKKLDQENRHP